MKSDKIPYIIYAGIESLIRKIDECANNPEKSPTMKIGEHIPCGYSMSTIWGFDHIENKHKDCMKKRKRIRKKHNYFEKKKMLPLTKEELKLNQETKEYYIYGKGILEKFAKDKND